MDRYEVDELRNRLQRLERRIFIMGAGWLLSFVLLVVLWVGAPHASSQTGRPRVHGLDIIDRNDRTRVALGVTDSGGLLQLFDSNGRERLSFGISSIGNPGAWFEDANGKARIHLGIYYGKAPGILFLDENGNDRMRLGLADAEARSKFFADQPGSPPIALLYDPSGPARFGFYAAGRQHAALGGNGRGDAGFWLFDAGGKPVWSAPHGLFGGVKP